MAEMERAELDADETRHFEPQSLHQTFHFAVLAFLERDAGPGVHALAAFEVGDHRTIFYAVNRDAGGQPVEIGLRHLAEQPCPVCALPAARWQFGPARELSVVGEEQEAFRIEVEPADRHDARQMARQIDEDGWSSFRILVRRDESGGLVVPPEPRRFFDAERLTVDRDG